MPASDDLSRELARHVLTLGFTEDDQARMRDLAARNQEGELSPEEREELANYVKAGHLLALLHSKAGNSLAAPHKGESLGKRDLCGSVTRKAFASPSGSSTKPA